MLNYPSFHSELIMIRRQLRTIRRLACLLSIAAFASAEQEAPPFEITRDIYYGDETVADRNLQSLDVYWQNKQQKLPVVVYVHGGGWAFGDNAEVHEKPGYFLSKGIAFVSMNYRLRWDHRIFDQAEDIASVVAWIKSNAEAYSLDADKIILMGHAAGAHLVSLVATNQSYLKVAGLALGDITSVVAIDTASFDINRLMIDLGSFVERRQHQLIFESEEEVWKQSLPIHHVSSDKNIPSVAIIYAAQQEETKLQAMGFAKKLNAADVEAIMIPGNEKTAQSVNEELGKTGDVSTHALMAFLLAKI